MLAAPRKRESMWRWSQQQRKPKAVSLPPCWGCLHALHWGCGCLLCAVGRTVPSIPFAMGLCSPWGLLWPLPGTGGLSTVSLCATGAPFLLLLVPLGLLSCCWPSFWTLVVSIALLSRVELWTVYTHSEALLFIFLSQFLLMMIYFYLPEGKTWPVKTKYFRSRALEEILYQCFDITVYCFVLTAKSFLLLIKSRQKLPHEPMMTGKHDVSF